MICYTTNMDYNNEQLDKILKLTEENNRILRGMRRSHNFASLMRIIYIALFIYASYWAYKQMMPYMEQVKTLVQQVSELSKTTQGAKESISPELLKLLDKLPK